MIRASLDVGNSRFGWVLWREGAPAVSLRLDGPAEVVATLREQAPEAVAAISVAPARLDRLLALLGPDARRVTQLREPPSDLGTPGLLASAGSDRIACALALRPGPAIVVDAGTAVTVDLVDSSGRFRGGFIAPGPAATAAGLVGATARLPAIPGNPAPLLPGGDTLAAMSAGVWGLVLGGVDRLVDAALEAAGASHVPIIATGGWGQAWSADTRHRGVSWRPDLVHEGIARWAGWA